MSIVVDQVSKSDHFVSSLVHLHDASIRTRMRNNMGESRNQRGIRMHLKTVLRDQSGKRHLRLALFLVLLAGLHAQPAVPQYDSTVWTSRAGLPSVVHAIAQTNDGYLWLGTAGGLIRFDGVRFVTWKPKSGQVVPWSLVSSLCAARDGSLWAGAQSGIISRIHGGDIQNYSTESGLRGAAVSNLLETHDGVLWAGTLGGLYRLNGNRWIRYGAAKGVPDGIVVSMVEDRDGMLWVSTQGHILRLKAGASEFTESVAPPVGHWPHLSTGSDGSMWFYNDDHHEIERIIDGRPGAPLDVRPVGPQMILQTGPSEFWLPGEGDGVIWVHDHDDQGKPLSEHFARGKALPDDDAYCAIRDREGDIWVGTGGGLVRFRKRKFTVLTAAEGLPRLPIFSIEAGGNGGIWAATRRGLVQIGANKTEVVELPGTAIAIAKAREGGFWVSSGRGVARVQDGRLTWINTDLRVVVAIVEGSDGTLWLSDYVQGLWKWQSGRLTSLHDDPVIAANRSNTMFGDRRGRVWISFSSGGLAVREGGKFRAFSTADGLTAGAVMSFLEDDSGTIWLGCERGLSRFDGNRFVTLGTENGLPAGQISWILEDKDKSFWLGFGEGLARVRKQDLEAAVTVPGRIPYTLYDAADGLESNPVRKTNPAAIEAVDGTLWFMIATGLAAINPRQIVVNTLPPPVYLESITVDGKELAGLNNLHIPARPRRLKFDYTATSLIAPEKVLFRYKLEGYETEWQEAGTRREAFYNDLRPGSYRFRVIACNNDGLWNGLGATSEFSIEPAFYQTSWFAVCCAIGSGALLWGAYRLRLRQVAAQLNLRFETRLDERTRIARELHDTLLQSFQGLMLRFQTVGDLLPSQPLKAKEELETALDRADAAIVEGRDAVRGLRSSTVNTNDLGDALNNFGQELAAGASIQFQLLVEGSPRDLHPLLRDEIYRIGREALQNAFRHALASQIEIEITYDPKLFRMRVRDNGEGIDPQILDAGERHGHWGLPGMRERAKRIGAALDIWSRPRAGTEIDLNLPGYIAYGTTRENQS